MPLPEQSASEESEILQEVAEQAVRGLKALNNLAQVAMRDRNAQAEAQQQIGLVAQALLGLAQRYREENFGEVATWLGQNLPELSAYLNLAPAVTIDPATGMSEEEAKRRLALTLPVTEESENGKELANASKRRVIIASLEQVDSALPLIVTAAHSFDRERWVVTNLGYHVPIMALTSTVQEIRPSVLVLIVARGQLISESARLIEDLKKTFLGLKVVAIGPPFATQSVLGERLGADLHDPDAEKTAELAEQALHPLNRLSEPLALSIENMTEEEPPSAVLAEDLPAFKVINIVEEGETVRPEILTSAEEAKKSEPARPEPEKAEAE